MMNINDKKFMIYKNDFDNSIIIDNMNISLDEIVYSLSIDEVITQLMNSSCPLSYQKRRKSGHPNIDPMGHWQTCSASRSPDRSGRNFQHTGVGRSLKDAQ